MAIIRAWRLFCDECGEAAAEAVPLGDSHTPTKLRAELKQAGWTYDGGEDVCDRCNRRAHSKYASPTA